MNRILKLVVIICVILLINLCGCSDESNKTAQVSVQNVENIYADVSEQNKEVSEKSDKTESLSSLLSDTMLWAETPMVINEAVVSEYSTEYSDLNQNFDWIELKNKSKEVIDLSQFWISDDINDLYMYRFPDETLNPGELFIVICDSNEYENYPSSGFSLDAESEDVYLSNSTGIVDYVHLEDIPLGGSYGRLPNQEGFYYFKTSSFNSENSNGKKFISDSPSSNTEPGVFENVTSVDVELTGEGDIYYTTDGSLPNENSKRYTEPITLTTTTIVRAVAVQNGGIESKSITLPFFINEGHSLPVISIVTDNPGKFTDIFTCGNSHCEQPGNIALFENGQCFNLDCGVSISGKTSRYLFPKKNLKISFRSSYGKTKLKYDLFGDGETSYKSLNLRAGQDSSFRLFNSDMWQDLALEMDNKAITQHTKHCILYVNGKYYGIYSLKENVSKAFYAEIMDVSDDSVVQCDIPRVIPDEFRNEVYDFLVNNDMSKEENYAYISEKIDIDNFIDYLIIEGVSANEDLAYNVKAFRSTEGDGKWRFVLYDLDGAMKTGSPWGMLFKDYPYGFPNNKLTSMMLSLLKNATFRDALLKRYSSVYSTILSNDNIVSTAEEYRSLLSGDIKRDREKWYYSVSTWNSDVDAISHRVTTRDWQNLGVQNLCEKYLKMTEEEIKEYFPQYNYQ